MNGLIAVANRRDYEWHYMPQKAYLSTQVTLCGLTSATWQAHDPYRRRHQCAHCQAIAHHIKTLKGQ